MSESSITRKISIPHVHVEVSRDGGFFVETPSFRLENGLAVFTGWTMTDQSLGKDVEVCVAVFDHAAVPWVLRPAAEKGAFALFVRRGKIIVAERNKTVERRARVMTEATEPVLFENLCFSLPSSPRSVRYRLFRKNPTVSMSKAAPLNSAVHSVTRDELKTLALPIAPATLASTAFDDGFTLPCPSMEFHYDGDREVVVNVLDSASSGVLLFSDGVDNDDSVESSPHFTAGSQVAPSRFLFVLQVKTGTIRMFEFDKVAVEEIEYPYLPEVMEIEEVAPPPPAPGSDSGSSSRRKRDRSDRSAEPDASSKESPSSSSSSSSSCFATPAKRVKNGPPPPVVAASTVSVASAAAATSASSTEPRISPSPSDGFDELTQQAPNPFLAQVASSAKTHGSGGPFRIGSAPVHSSFSASPAAGGSAPAS